MAKQKLDDRLKQIIENLSIVHCTYREIAIAVGVHEDTLYKSKEYSSIIEKGREKGKQKLRTAMFKSALNGNVVMQIFLSKNLLGYTDKTVVDNNNNLSLTLNYAIPKTDNNKIENQNSNLIQAEFKKNEEK